MSQKVFILILLVMLQNLYAMDVQITDKELGFYITPEYNRVFNFCGDTSAAAVITMNSRYSIESGLAMGAVGSSFDIKLFAGGEMPLGARFPFCLSLAYTYNGLPKYENHTHSIPILVSFKEKWAGISLGPNFRFTSFLGEPPVFEPVLSFLVYVFFINNERLQLGLKAANFDDFTYGNFGEYFLNINSVIHLNKKISIVNEIEILQSGSVALASNFYGLLYRGGAKLSW